MIPIYVPTQKSKLWVDSISLIIVVSFYYGTKKLDIITYLPINYLYNLYGY